MPVVVTVSYSWGSGSRAPATLLHRFAEPRGGEPAGGQINGVMNHALRSVMAANDGLLTWAQARDGGLTSTQLRHLLRVGVLVALRRGVYVDGELWRSLDPYREQHRLRTRAVLRGLKRGYVVSHDSAAYELGLDILAPPVPHTHITRRGSTTAWTCLLYTSPSPRDS